MFVFSSRRRDPVRVHTLKGFDEAYGAAVRGRIQAIGPGYYTRMGAAIRYATDLLSEQPAGRRLLLLLSDGKPNDLDKYEGRYGIEDTRHAVQQARRQGLTPFCVTIDERGNDYLPHLFGTDRRSYPCACRSFTPGSRAPRLRIDNARRKDRSDHVSPQSGLIAVKAKSSRRWCNCACGNLRTAPLGTPIHRRHTTPMPRKKNVLADSAKDHHRFRREGDHLFHGETATCRSEATRDLALLLRRGGGRQF